MRVRLRRRFVFWGFRLSSLLIILLPLKLGQFLGRLFGIFAYYTLTRERQIAFENLKDAFGRCLSFSERKKTIKLLFKNLGQSIVEIINLPRIAKHIDRFIVATGMEKVGRALKEAKGGIVISAHFGNWELLAHYLAIKGYPINVIARRMRYLDFENLLRRQRQKHHLNVLYRNGAFKEAVELLRQNELLGIIPDQDMDGVEGVFVNFFGRPAYTPIGPAVFTILTGAPIIPCFIVHSGRTHKIIAEDPLEFIVTGNKEKDILEVTQKYTKVIEDFIRRYPSEWVWFHRRWKTQPI